MIRSSSGTLVYKTIVLLMSVFAVLGMNPAHAVLISYDESIDGDLPTIFSFPVPSANVFQFDVGTNTFSGSGFWQDPFTSADFDFIPFSLPSGTSLASVNFTATQIGGAGGLIDVSPRLTRLDASFDFSGDLIEQQLAVPFNGTVFGAVLPAEAGNYLACICTLTGFLDEGSILYGYRWDFEVSRSPVSAPEPSSVLLLASGLAGVAVIRKRLRF